MELELRHTPVYTWNLAALENKNYRFIVNQGGSRSSKTYSICQMLVVYCLTHKKKTVSIVRKSFPALRASVLKDVFEILEELGLYSEKNHNKSENIYEFANGSRIEFFSVDDAQKLRGRKRDILYANEANELTYEEFTQLNLRTTTKLIFDFNPSDNYSWLYSLIENEKAILIKSTYRDNPFIDDSIVQELEALKDVDEGYYRVYALGEQASLKETIFNHYSFGDYVEGEKYYGLDLGYNHPTALVELSVSANTAYVKELIYSSNLTNNDLLARIKALNIDKSIEMLVDSARPDVIEELKRAGYKAKGANKAVKEGITAISYPSKHRSS